MDQHLQIVKTADGSNTIYNAAVGENYHSRNGALQESLHVFVNAGAGYFLDERAVNEVSILEVGFGTGLNFLLTADFCSNRSTSLKYTGIEAYPLTPEMISQTGYEQYIPIDLWETFIKNYAAALVQPVEVTANCQLQIADCALLDFRSENKFDIIYFDAFAAMHQPEMWAEQSISHTIQFLKPGGVFVTYAITGNLKRMLKGLGLQIQKIPGALGKREMLRAVNLI